MIAKENFAFISLNTFRFISIIALLLVLSSQLVVFASNVKAIHHYNNVSEEELEDLDDLKCNYIMDTDVPQAPGGEVNSMLSRLLLVFQCILLIMSESGLKFFDRFFGSFLPVIGKGHGTAVLGTWQIILASSALSHFLPEFARVSAWLLFAVGIIYFVLGFVVRRKLKVLRGDPPEPRASELPRNIFNAKGPEKRTYSKAENGDYLTTSGPVSRDVLEQRAASPANDASMRQAGPSPWIAFGQKLKGFGEKSRNLNISGPLQQPPPSYPSTSGPGGVKEKSYV